MAGKMKNVDIFVANRMRIIENLTASKSEIFHQNFVTDSVVNRLPLEFVTRCSCLQFLLLFVGVLVS